MHSNTSYCRIKSKNAYTICTWITCQNRNALQIPEGEIMQDGNQTFKMTIQPSLIVI